jgi:hypothetical protein
VLTGRDVEELLAAIVRALEALEDGDPMEAAAILRSVLHQEPGPRPYRCPTCASCFRWPGELDEHLARSRCGLEAA